MECTVHVLHVGNKVSSKLWNMKHVCSGHWKI